MEKSIEYNDNVGGVLVSSEKGKIVISSDSSDGGMFMGKSHAEDGGIKVQNKETGEPILVEGGESIINKRSMASKEEVICVGNPRQVASNINEIGDGVKFAEGGACYRKEDFPEDLWEKLSNFNRKQEYNEVSVSSDRNHISLYADGGILKMIRSALGQTKEMPKKTEKDVKSNIKKYQREIEKTRDDYRNEYKISGEFDNQSYLDEIEKITEKYEDDLVYAVENDIYVPVINILVTQELNEVLEKNKKSISLDDIKRIETILKSDDLSTDEELVEFFIDDIGLTKAQAKAWVGKRNVYLTNPFYTESYKYGMEKPKYETFFEKNSDKQFEIFSSDMNYPRWQGNLNDIKSYLEESKELINNYDPSDIEGNLKKLNLNYRVYDLENERRLDKVIADIEKKESLMFNKGGSLTDGRRKIKGINFDEQISNNRKFKELITKVYNNQPQDDVMPMNFIEEIAFSKNPIVSHNGNNYIKGYLYKGSLTNFLFLDDPNFIEALKYVEGRTIRKFEDGGNAVHTPTLELIDRDEDSETWVSLVEPYIEMRIDYEATEVSSPVDYWDYDTDSPRTKQELYEKMVGNDYELIEIRDENGDLIENPSEQESKEANDYAEFLFNKYFKGYFIGGARAIYGDTGFIKQAECGCEIKNEYANGGGIGKNKYQQASDYWKQLESQMTFKQKKFYSELFKRRLPKYEENMNDQDIANYINGEIIEQFGEDLGITQYQISGVNWFKLGFKYIAYREAIEHPEFWEEMNEYAKGGGVDNEKRKQQIIDRRIEINDYLNIKYGRSRGKNKAEKKEIEDLRKEYNELGEEYNSYIFAKGGGVGEGFDFIKSAIESASGDKISHIEYDDYDEKIYWSKNIPHTTYYIGRNDSIVKYDGKTGKTKIIGELKLYDNPKEKANGGGVGEYPIDYHLHAIQLDNGKIYTGKSYYDIISNQPVATFSIDERTRGYVDKDGVFHPVDLESGISAYKNGGGVGLMSLEEIEKEIEELNDKKDKLKNELLDVSMGIRPKSDKVKIEAKIQPLNDRLNILLKEKYIKNKSNYAKGGGVDDNYVKGGSSDLNTKEKAEMYSWITDFIENNGDNLYEEFAKKFNKTEEQAFDIIDNGWAISRGYYKKGGSIENNLWSFESKLFDANLYYEESWIQKRLPEGAVIDYISARNNNKYDAFRIKYSNQPDILKDGISPNLPVIERVWGIIHVDYYLSENSDELEHTEISFDTDELPEFINKDGLNDDNNKWGYVLYLNNSYVANFPEELEIDFKNKNIVIQFGNPDKNDFDYYKKGGNVKDNDIHSESKKNTGYDDEHMAMVQLDIIHRYAAKIDKMIDSGVRLEEWIKAKLSKIELMISSVKHALVGIEKFDDGGEMARKQLLHIGKYAAKLIEMLKSGSKLMSWMESDIAICADYIDSIYHHLDYESGNRATEMQYANGGAIRTTKKEINNLIEELKRIKSDITEYKENLQKGHREFSDYELEMIENKYLPELKIKEDFIYGQIQYALKRYMIQTGKPVSFDSKTYDFLKQEGFENGGNITTGQPIMSFAEFERKLPVLHDIKWGDKGIEYIAKRNPYTGTIMYFKYGRINSEKVSIKSAYDHYKYFAEKNEEYANGGGIRNKEYEVYHNTLYSVIDEIEKYITNKGYEVGEFFPEFSHISYGTTFRTYADMLLDGIVKNQMNIQVYRMDSGRYELNMYPNKPIKMVINKMDTSNYAKGGIYTNAIHLEPERFKNFKWYYSRIDKNHLVGKEKFLGLEYYVGFQKGNQIADWKYDLQDEALYTDMNIYEVAAISKGSIKPRLNENGGSIADSIKKGTEIELEHKETIKKIQKNHNLSVRDVAELIAKDHIAKNPNHYE